MASPMSATWWGSFLDTQGRDSEEETAFVGYLSAQGIDAGADPDVLEAAYAAFHTFMEESAAREADRGPSRAELAAKLAVAAAEQQFVPKSRVSMPGVEKPATAATNPASSEEPGKEPKAGAVETAPAHQATSTSPAHEESRGGRPGRRGTDD